MESWMNFNGKEGHTDIQPPCRSYVFLFPFVKVQVKCDIVWISEQVFFRLFSGGDELENVTESLVAEGLVEVRRGGIKPSE